MNLGSLYLVMIFYLICFLVLPLTKMSCCKNNKYSYKIGYFFTKDLIWNGPIEFFSSSYMEILFAVILNSN
jgi:hypothetical protein